MLTYLPAVTSPLGYSFALFLTLKKNLLSKPLDLSVFQAHNPRFPNFDASAHLTHFFSHISGFIICPPHRVHAP